MDFKLKENVDGELNIIDLTGQTVRHQKLKTHGSINISLVPGLYFYLVQMNGEIKLSDKLIIIR